MSDALTDADVKVLLSVRKFSTEDRNPEWGNNPRRMKHGFVCNSAAAATDLGSSQKKPDVMLHLEKLVKRGLLVRVFDKSRRTNYAFFQLTQTGHDTIAASAASKK